MAWENFYEQMPRPETDVHNGRILEMPARFLPVECQRHTANVRLDSTWLSCHRPIHLHIALCFCLSNRWCERGEMAISVPHRDTYARPAERWLTDTMPRTSLYVNLSPTLSAIFPTDGFIQIKCCETWCMNSSAWHLREDVEAAICHAVTYVEICRFLKPSMTF